MLSCLISSITPVLVCTQACREQALALFDELGCVDRPRLLATPDENLAPHRLLTMLHGDFDTEHGGFGGSPKFPQPTVLDAMEESDYK